VTACLSFRIDPAAPLHCAYRRGVILDPFAGSGTTLAVAEGCGRDSIGIELYPHNADLIRERVGMFLEEVA
jgi:DNA modification methylase